MRQEIISDQKSQKYKIIHYPFKIVFKWRLHILKFQAQVLSNHCDLHILKLYFSGQSRLILNVVGAALECGVTSLFALEADAVFLLTNGFPQHEKVDFVCCQTQHDQISIRPINTMPLIWVIGRLGALTPNKV